MYGNTDYIYNVKDNIIIDPPKNSKVLYLGAIFLALQPNAEDPEFPKLAGESVNSKELLNETLEIVTRDARLPQGTKVDIQPLKLEGMAYRAQKRTVHTY